MSQSEELKLVITGKNEAKAALDEVKAQTQAVSASAGDASQAGAALGLSFAGATIALTKAADVVAETVKAIVELSAEAEKIEQKSLITGMATDSVQALQRLAENADVSGETVFRAVTKMQRAAVEGSDGFKALGLGAQEFLAMAPEAQLQAIARQIMAIPDPAARAAEAVALFGRSGAELLPILAEIATRGLGGMVMMSEEQVRQMAALDNSIDHLKGSLKDLANQALVKVGGGQSIFDHLAIGAEGLARYLKESNLSDMLADLATGQTYNKMVHAAVAPPPSSSSLGSPRPFTPMGTGFTREQFEEQERKDNARAVERAEDAKRRAIEKTARDHARAQEKMTRDEGARIDASIRAGLGLADAERAMYDQLANDAEKAEARKSALHQAAARDQLEVDRWLEQQRREAEREEQQRLEETYRAFMGLLDAARDFGNAIGGAFGKAISTGAGALQTFMALSKQLEQLNGKAATYAKIQAGLSAATSAYSGGSALGGAATGAATGLAIGGPLGAAIGGIGGAILGFFGGKSKEKKEQAQVNETRQQFVEAAGGMDALRAKADAAHVSLTRLFNAKTPKEYEAAVKDVQRALDLHDQAIEETQKAIDKYGITIDQLGPKWRQQELDKQAASLLKEYTLLSNAGVQQSVLIEKMGAELNDYVNTAVRAGGEIPQAMKPTIDALYEQGKLVHEDGTAYTEAEYKALKYGQTTSEQFQSMIDLLAALVKAVGGELPAAFRTAGDEAERQGGRMRRSIPDRVPSYGGSGGGDGGDSGDVPQMARGGVVLPFIPRAAAGIVSAPRPGGVLVNMAEAGKPEVALPVEALLQHTMQTALAASGGGERTVHVHLNLGHHELASQIVRLNRSGWLPIEPSSVQRR